jgi:hypothetical protein
MKPLRASASKPSADTCTSGSLRAAHAGAKRGRREVMHALVGLMAPFGRMPTQFTTTRRRRRRTTTHRREVVLEADARTREGPPRPRSRGIRLDCVDRGREAPPNHAPAEEAMTAQHESRASPLLH